MASFVKKFDSAVGSKPDGANIAINAIDNYDSARFSCDVKNAFLEGVFNKEVKNIVALDLGFYKGKERRTLLLYLTLPKRDLGYVMLTKNRVKNITIIVRKSLMVMKQ